MDKKVIFFTLTLVLILTLTVFAEEEFTITTYYPSPYGSYNQLEVYRSVKYHAVNKDELKDPQEGETVFNASDETFYYYNGQKWLAQGGQGGYFLQCGSCPSGTTKVGNAQYGTTIGGAMARGGYTSNDVIAGESHDGVIPVQCKCWCSEHIAIGNGVTAECGTKYLCGQVEGNVYYIGTGETATSYCQNYCNNNAPSTQVKNISICK